MGRDDMRAGDADRQQVADRLKSALDEGRLDLFEYDERLQQAYAAKTYGDLDQLLLDLPTTVPTQRSQLAPVTGGVAPARPQPAFPDATRRWLLENWSGYVGVVALCVGIWLVTALSSGGLLYFWPIWVIGPWGAILAWHTISGLASGEPQRWAAATARKHEKARKLAGEKAGKQAPDLDEKA